MFRITLILLGVFMATQILYYGNKALAQEHRGEALAFMQKLENMKSLGKLDQIWSPVHTLKDGTEIRLQSIYDAQTIRITSPFVTKEVKEEIPEEFEMQQHVKTGRFIITYGDGNDGNSPYTRYLWSTLNGRTLIALPSFGDQKANGRGFGKRIAISDGLICFLEQVAWKDVKINISKDYGKTWGTPLLVHTYGGGPWFIEKVWQDVQIDKSGWIWVGVLDVAKRVFFYVSKDKGQTFTLAGSQTGINNATDGFNFSVVSDGATRNLFFSLRNTDYMSFSIWKAVYTSTSFSVSNIYTYSLPVDADNFPRIAASKTSWVMIATGEPPGGGFEITRLVRNGSVVWTSPYGWIGNQQHSMIRNYNTTFVATCDTDPYTAQVMLSIDDGASWIVSAIPDGSTILNNSLNYVYSQSVDVYKNKIAYSILTYFVGTGENILYIYEGTISDGSVAWERIYTETLPLNWYTSVQGNVRIYKEDKVIK